MSTSKQKQKESEIGILKNIRYQKDDFIIASFENQGKSKDLKFFSGLGNIMNPEVGIAYKLFGKWENNDKFGKQYKFNFYEVIQPSSTRGIYQYLVRVCKYVGPTVAGRIVGKYKENALDILKTDPHRVANDIKGLTLDRAKEIRESLKKQEYIEKVLVELEKIFSDIAGTRKSLPFEIAKMWGSDAVEKLKENPYRLTRLRGVGFPTADNVALSLGFNRKSQKRCKAAIFHVVNKNMHSQGSVWIEEKDLVSEVTNLIGFWDELILVELVEKGGVVSVDSQIALSEMEINESYIAKKIIEMVTYERNINETSQDQSLPYSQLQN